MSMFFYRTWAGLGDVAGAAGYDPFNDQLYQQFRYHSWGYGVLLGATLVASLVLNTGLLLAFAGGRNLRRMPHWSFLCLCIRDLLATLVLIPSCIDWFVVNIGLWSSGYVWCRGASFIDFALTAEYPLILIALAIILCSRRYISEDEDGLGLPMDEVEPFQGQQGSVIMQQQHMGSRPPSMAQGSRAPSAMQMQQQQRQYYKPPSVAASMDGYRPGKAAGPPIMPSPQQRQPSRPPSVANSSYSFGQPQPRQPQHQQKTPFYVTPNRPGSVTGSIEGRLAAGRMSAGARRPLQGMNDSRPPSVISPPGGRVSQLRNQAAFRTSSPLREVDEAASVGDAEDLWEEASLDYPGRESPRAWDFMMDDSEVRYHSWTNWLLWLTWALAIGLGVPAALMTEEVVRKRPGCYIPVDPFQNPYSQTVTDPGFNFMLSFVILTFGFPVLALTALITLIYCNRMADKRFATFAKILTTLFCIFLLARSPIDLIQLKGLVEAAMGYNLRDPVEIEYEIVLVWTTYLPLLLNPIVLFSFLSEYRLSAVGMLRRICCGARADLDDEKMSKYKEQEIMESKSTVSKTQVSNIL